MAPVLPEYSDPSSPVRHMFFFFFLLDFLWFKLEQNVAHRMSNAVIWQRTRLGDRPGSTVLTFNSAKFPGVNSQHGYCFHLGVFITGIMQSRLTRGFTHDSLVLTALLAYLKQTP